METYNKYRESLNIDCGCSNTSQFTKTNKTNCCSDRCNLASSDNTIEVLIKQLQREVKELINTTQAKLLCQDKQIAECCTYIKNNLLNLLIVM